MNILFSYWLGLGMNKPLSPYINNNTPAFAALIIKNGKTVFKDVQGCAVLRQGKCISKATMDTPFPICSITKHFTAAAILILEEEGKLSTNDCISKYISDLSTQFKDIKIKHLIFHISGIPDYLPNLTDFIQMIDEGKQFENILSSPSNSELQPCSTAYRYSNSGYVLLTRIIENISNQSYGQFIKQHIFDKFDMKTAFMISELDQRIHYAEAYGPWPLYIRITWENAINPSGDGGIFMSINDMEKWIHAFEQHKIFTNEKTMQKFLSVGKYDDGADVVVAGPLKNKYGFGLAHGEVLYRNKKYNRMGHRGFMLGSAAKFSNFCNAHESIWVIYFNNAGTYPCEFDILNQAQIEY